MRSSPLPVAVVAAVLAATLDGASAPASASTSATGLAASATAEGLAALALAPPPPAAVLLAPPRVSEASPVAPPLTIATFDGATLPVADVSAMLGLSQVATAVGAGGNDTSIVSKGDDKGGFIDTTTFWAILGIVSFVILGGFCCFLVFFYGLGEEEEETTPLKRKRGLTVQPEEAAAPKEAARVMPVPLHAVARPAEQQVEVMPSAPMALLVKAPQVYVPSPQAAMYTQPVQQWSPAGTRRTFSIPGLRPVSMVATTSAPQPGMQQLGSSGRRPLGTSQSLNITPRQQAPQVSFPAPPFSYSSAPGAAPRSQAVAPVSSSSLSSAMSASSTSPTSFSSYTLPKSWSGAGWGSGTGGSAKHAPAGGSGSYPPGGYTAPSSSPATWQLGPQVDLDPGQSWG